MKIPIDNGDGSPPAIFTVNPCNGIGPEIKFPNGASVGADYYNKKQQVLVWDGDVVPGNPDPALSIRLNDDGSIAEIAVRSDLMSKVMLDGAHSPWIEARDRQEVQV